jgi:hypothetical protein
VMLDHAPDLGTRVPQLKLWTASGEDLSVVGTSTIRVTRSRASKPSSSSGSITTSDALIDQLWSAIEMLPDPEPQPDPKRLARIPKMRQTPDRSLGGKADRRIRWCSPLSRHSPDSGAIERDLPYYRGAPQ